MIMLCSSGLDTRRLLIKSESIVVEVKSLFQIDWKTGSICTPGLVLTGYCAFGYEVTKVQSCEVKTEVKGDGCYLH